MTTRAAYLDLTPGDVIAAHKAATEAKEHLFRIPAWPKRPTGKDLPSTAFIPIEFRSAQGTWGKLRLKFKNAMLGGKAMPPKATPVKGQLAKPPGKVNLTFMKLDQGVFVDSRYNKPEKHAGLLAINHELIAAFDIIADAFESLVAREFPKDQQPEKLWYIMDCWKVPSFRQATRKPGEGEGNKPIKLDKPIYRLSVKWDLAEGAFGRTQKFGEGPSTFKPSFIAQTVDGTKREAKYVSGVVNAKPERVSLDNVGQYCSARSMVLGRASFDSVCCSPFGVSLAQSADELVVVTHVNKASSAWSNDDIADASSMMDTSVDPAEDSAAAGSTSPKPKPKPSNAFEAPSEMNVGDVSTPAPNKGAAPNATTARASTPDPNADADSDDDADDADDADGDADGDAEAKADAEKEAKAKAEAEEKQRLADIAKKEKADKAKKAANKAKKEAAAAAAVTEST